MGKAAGTSACRVPTKWDVLYDHFDQNQHRTGEIGPALRHLAHWRHISHISVVGSVATITASGMEQVKSLK
jgi:hypothetical protein